MKRTVLLAFVGVLTTMLVDHACAAATPTERYERARLAVDNANGDIEKLRAAYVDLQALAAEYPKDARYLVQLARVELYAGYQYGDLYTDEARSRAEETLRAALAIDPGAGDAYVGLADLMRLQFRLDEASAFLAKAEAASADPKLVNLARAQIHVRKQDCKAGLPIFEDLEQRSGNREWIVRLANEGVAECATDLKEYAVADAAYKRRIARYPKDAWAHGNYSVFLRTYRNDLDAAETNARRALALRNYGAARTALASVLYMKWGRALIDEKNAEKAARLFAEARALNPDPGIVLRTAASWPTVQPVVPALKQIGVSMDWGTEARGSDSLLSSAVSERNHDYALQLLNLGADVDARGYRNATPLMLAAVRGDSQMTNLLLSRGADPSAENDNGETAADYAKKRGFDDLATALARAPLPPQSAPPPRDPRAPFRVGWTYRVKQRYVNSRWGQDLQVGEEMRYMRTYDETSTGEHVFVFMGPSSPLQRSWRTLPDGVSAWDQYFDEVGKIRR